MFDDFDPLELVASLSRDSEEARDRLRRLCAGRIGRLVDRTMAPQRPEPERSAVADLMLGSVEMYLRSRSCPSVEGMPIRVFVAMILVVAYRKLTPAEPDGPGWPVLGDGVGEEALLGRYVAGHATLDERLPISSALRAHPALYRCLETVRYVLDTDPIAGVPHIPSPIERVDRDYLLDRYRDAIKRYLQVKLGGTELSDEVYKEFCIKQLDHTLVEPDGPLGRFREYLRSVLHRLIIDHYRDKGKDIARSPEADLLDESRPDRVFDLVWREAVLTQAMTRLERFQVNRPENPFHTVLQLRSHHPKASINDLAAKLSEQVGRPVTPRDFRKLLQQARSLFFDLLINEVSSTIAHPEPGAIRDELDNLGLGRRPPPPPDPNANIE
jgi:RNA polymerase sigma-70 factor (ECF subfamily)